MKKISVKLLLLAFVLAWLGIILPGGEVVQAAQTINGKALGSVDDVVKEVNKGDLSLPKKGLITIRGGDFQDNTYADVYASVFGSDGSASDARKIFTTYPTSDPAVGKYEEKKRFVGGFMEDLYKISTVRVPVYEGEPKFFRPAVSRKLYNGKRALMFHNIAPNGSLKYYFKTLSNTIGEDSADLTPTALVNSVNITDFGTYTSPAFSNAENLIGEVYGTGVMSVKGYDSEIFVAASGLNRVNIESVYDPLPFGSQIYRYGVSPKTNQEVRLEFFAINADSEGNMTQEPLTALTRTTPFRNKPHIVSIAVGDFDGDKYNNELALMIHSSKEIKLFVYRLSYSDGKLTLRSMSDASGMEVYSSTLWLNYLEEQPVADMTVGDFDADGKDEIAVLYKRPSRATALKDERGWRDGPVTGDINCMVYQWNANSRNFVTDETAKAYNKEELIDSAFDMLPEARVAGVVGLRAAAADLDGDGKSEIVTLLLGYYHHKQWDAKIKAYKLRRDDFYVYPHLAVWTFNRGSIKPVHDEAHVKGGVESGENRYNFGPLYEYVKNQNAKLLGDKPFLEWRYIWYDSVHKDRNKNEGTSPDSVRYMYAPRMFSIAAGPFTGRLGTFRTVDDIAVTWRDTDGNDCVTIFKTKVNAAQQFDGFEDGKLAMKDKANSSANGQMTFRGLVAVDLAAEGVELDTPVHLRKKSNRSYIAALNAVPYHVDTVNADGSALTGGEPVNFTYSEFMNGGDMSVSYGKSTTDSTTNTVKMDLSQSVETMFAADPTGTDESVQGTLGTVKGLTAFASAIGGIAFDAYVEGMSPEAREKAVWEPKNPTEGLTDMIDFFTDKVDSIDQRTNSETSSTTIDKNITATTHDAILYTDTARHIWRYPVMTRPLPMWLAWGPRVDSTPINPGEAQGDKELFMTFTMSENSPLHTSSSITDSMYQPLHEEGNFFSYPSQIADVEGYNDAGILADEDTWEFSSVMDNTGISFTKATSNMQHTEKTVTPSGFTMTTSFFDRLINGENAKGLNMPESDNPKTFSKEYSKTERISYSLQGSSTLTAEQAADHTLKMQPFVAKEGAMTLGTAVELSSTNHAQLWEPSSIYQQKPDPALLLPMKFVKKGTDFIANTYDKSAMKIRGIRFYVPDFAFYSDNRLVKGLNYEIRVPLYNASFKATGDFKVSLSWAADNSLTATKTPIGTVTMTLGGWKNDSNNNKGTAIFNWTPNLTTNGQYYFYVEIDPDNDLDEVHEGRYKTDNATINDYGGNNTGFYPFYVYDADDIRVSSSGVMTANKSGKFRAAADEIQITPLSFTDGDGKTITDMEDYIIKHSDDSFVPITANFNYSGPEVPYAFFIGCVLTPSGRAKLPIADLETVVDLNALELSDISDVFMLEDIALLNGNSQLTFNVSPAELIAEADLITATADSATFGILTLTDEEMEAVEEFYEGVDPSFTLEKLTDYLVSSATSETYMLSSDVDAFWKISNVKLNGTLSTSDEEDDDRDYLDITLETVSEDETAPKDYGQIAILTVSSIAGWTPKGEFEITVQKSIIHKPEEDGTEEWIETSTEVLKFDTSKASEDSKGSEGEDTSDNRTLSSSGGGCDSGISALGLGILFTALIIRRKAR